MIKLLFITQVDPRRELNGAQRYSNAWISGLLANGCAVDLYCLGGDWIDEGSSELKVIGLMRRKAGRLSSILSRLPRMVAQNATWEALAAVRKLVSSATYDVVVVDHFASSIPSIFRASCPVLYIMHNDEARSKQSFIGSITNPVLRLLHRLDLRKIKAHQERLLRFARVAACISPAELPRRLESRLKSVLVRPYYKLPEQSFSEKSSPSVICLVGTFIWTPKRIALYDFLALSVVRLASIGLRLRVAGTFLAHDLLELRDRYPAVEFLSDFASPADVLSDAVIGLCIDGAGGGFKIKTLDYVAHKVAIFGLQHDLLAVPELVSGRDCVVFESVESLLDGLMAYHNRGEVLSEMSAAALVSLQPYFSRKRLVHEVGEALDAVGFGPGRSVAR